MSNSNRSIVLDLAVWTALAGSIAYAATRLPELQSAINQQMQAHAAATPAAGHGGEREGAAVASPETVELKADGNGHFRSDMEVNGRNIDAMVDTGATIVMLTYEDAERAGIFLHDRDFTLSMQTANGISRAAPVRIDRLAIGPILVRDVDAAVAERGVLHTNLLGMSFLKRLQRFEVRSGRLVLQE